MPDLDFQVVGAEVLPYAAVPTLVFTLGIENLGREPIRSVTLKTQIRILATQRHYTSDEQERLTELFGDSQRWGETLKSMVWTHSIVVVPSFTNRTVVTMQVPCTYDFDVVSAKYFHGLEHGEIPLEFLFSGTIFYDSPTGLQVAQISWEKEAHYRMPASLWRKMMDVYFPNSAWLRLRKDCFDSLYAYRTRNGLATWEGAVERLLRASEEGTK